MLNIFEGMNKELIECGEREGGPGIRNMMDTVQEICFDFNYSGKRQAYLTEALEQADDRPLGNRIKLRRLYETQWTAKANSLNVFIGIPVPKLTILMEFYKEIDPWYLSVAAGTLCVLLTSHVGYRIYLNIILKSKLKGKQNEVKNNKMLLQQHLASLNISEKEIASITCLSLTQLQAKLSVGELKAIDVLHIYQLKAMSVDQKTNSISEVIAHLDEVADTLDSIPAGERGLLHGIPVSLKILITVKGYDANKGLVNQCFQPKLADSVITQVLRQHGAIPFVLTNMAQLGCSLDNSNPVYGETVNPHCPTRTSGGSSGGEGALLGGGGSVLGIGTDVGGSIRIPASYCGVCGFKPTAGRLSFFGVTSSTGTFGSLPVTVGPMARDVDACVLVMRALLSPAMFRLDRSVPPLVFNEEAFKPKKLRLGMYLGLDSGTVPEPIPAVKRAVREAAEVLRAMGHEVVDFSVPEVNRTGRKLLAGTLFADNFTSLKNYLQGDIVDPSISSAIRVVRLPGPIKFILKSIIGIFSPYAALSIDASYPKSNVTDVWSLLAEIDSYRQRFLASMESDHLDGIICPVSPFCAPPLGTMRYLGITYLYSSLYNLVNFPAGIVPVTRVTESDMAALAAEKGAAGGDFLVRLMHRWQRGSVGMPIGVQCVAKPWREEVCLRVMKDLETGVARRGAADE